MFNKVLDPSPEGMYLTLGFLDNKLAISTDASSL
jgi:hypothetical protein